ncbi:multiubiquitin domain-containing protein [Pseudoalteromonas sp. bablab_jr004]|uniref:multiubiquitin domain-containing protein n=1 Tax=Pseudoalteromonas sp. bablab_jr004 TaxID=2755065 RepID=UPI0018F50E82|nr:multiubiquitin domain-containing protein [Pseudoalteromonas sp. bablab_jr004]
MNSNNPPDQERIESENITLAWKEGRPLRPACHYLVEVRDPSWQGGSINIDDPVPTGRQILIAAGKVPVEQYMLLMVDSKGVLEEVELEEPVDIYQKGIEQFVAFESDRLYYAALNGVRFPWGQAYIREDILRQIANIAEDHAVWLERRNEPDRLLGGRESVNLDEPGLEKIYTKPKTWKLNVQGVVVNSEQPTIIARDALQAAGFNPDSGWILVLKVKGEPKQVIGMDDVIDLQNPGIEKLRLTPAEINNGEMAVATTKDFSLLEQDETYLNKQGFNWETRLVGTRRWLIIHDYVLPSGYNHKHIDLAIDIPTTYPDAELDMFFVHPMLTLSGGRVIRQTESRESILGCVYQRWSRHLNGKTRWNPMTDSVVTHLAVVEESLLREVGQ